MVTDVERRVFRANVFVHVRRAQRKDGATTHAV